MRQPFYNITPDTRVVALRTIDLLRINFRSSNNCIMFFASDLFNHHPITADTVRRRLSSPRIEYGEALTNWHRQMSRLQGYLQHKDEKSPYNSTQHRVTEQKIINCLKNGPMTTQSLGRKILGRTATSRRPIIAILHKMASDGVIIHHQIGDEHVWELTRSIKIAPIIVPHIPE